MFKKIFLRNFKSFDTLEFNMCAKKNVAQPLLAVYGENGSGKTNLVQSIAFLKESILTRTINRAQIVEFMRKDLMDSKTEGLDNQLKGALGGILEILGSKVADINLDIRSYAGSYRLIGSEGEMEVIYTFDVEGSEAEYRMCFGKDNRIMTESLRYKLNKNTTTFFECRLKEDRVSINLNDSVFKEKYSPELSGLLEKLWGNHTFLAILNEQFEKNNPSFMDDNVNKGIHKILNYIKNIKLNVFEQTPGDFLNQDEGQIPRGELGNLKSNENALNMFFTRLYSDIREVHYKISEKNGLIYYHLYFEKMIGGKIRDIPYELESQGTKKLIQIFPQLLGCADGSVAFIDELDSNIHDNLVFEMMQEIIPDIKGQLIITTHNTSLLEIAQPKSIYILQIDAEGHKTISSMDSIKKSQKNHNNRLRYRNGVYGGIPYIGEINLSQIADDFHHSTGDQ